MTTSRPKGDHLPPERIHARYVSGPLKQGDGKTYASVVVWCKTYDAGAADRAAALYAKTLQGIARPRVRTFHESIIATATDIVQVRPIYSTYRQVVTRRRAKGVQCKHIDDHLVLEAVRRANDGDLPYENPNALLDRAMVGYMEAELAQFPEKVVRAKVRRLVLRGLLSGCSSSRCVGCPCRGEWTITDKGRVLLAQRSYSDRIDAHINRRRP